MKQRVWSVCLCLFILSLLLPQQTLARPVAQTVRGTIPGGLPNHFWLGPTASLGDTWMRETGVPWNARYHYLSTGVNTGVNGKSAWSTVWQEQSPEHGLFVKRYLAESQAQGYMPVFTYYNMWESLPGAPGGEWEKNWANINNHGTMYSYYSDFKFLMQLLSAHPTPVIVHVEPDLWGQLHMRSNDPVALSAAVASSGHPDVQHLPNNVAGYARALTHLRNVYAPRVILAYHISLWGPGFDVGRDDFQLDIPARAQAWSNFFLACGPGWDLVFTDFLDGDAALFQLNRGDGQRWWDITNTTFPNFNRTADYLRELNQRTDKRIVIWQLPIGNTIMRSMNNTVGHYQDNRVQYFLADSNANIAKYADAGVIGILFGTGMRYEGTNHNDTRNDGITNPEPINGNYGWAYFPDDDGGYLRVQARAYYDRGAHRLPGNDVTAPTVPSILQPANTARSWALIQWSAATDTGSGLAGYMLQYQREGESGWHVQVNGTTATQALFLAPTGARYRFRVFALDRAGNMSPETSASISQFISFGSDRTGLRLSHLAFATRSNPKSW